MIFANKKLTNYMIKNNLPIIYRKFTENNNFNNYNLDKEIIKIFNQRNSDSAIYTFEKVNQDLMEGLYSHFTSPLRRWIDIYHQLIIYYSLKNNKSKINEIYENIKKKIDLINYKFKKIKKFHNEYNYFTQNIDLVNKEYSGYIYNLKKNI